MIEGLPEKIEKSGMSVTKLIGKAKSQWKRSKAQTVYTDEISKEEQKLFADDYELVRLVLAKIDIDRQINEHIDTILKEHRGGIQQKIEEMKKISEGMAVKEEKVI